MIGTLDVSSDDDHKSPATPTALTETMNKNKNSLNHESRQRKEKDKLHASAMFKRSIAVIAVAPTGKVSFVYSYVQTRLTGQYNGK